MESAPRDEEEKAFWDAAFCAALPIGEREDGRAERAARTATRSLEVRRRVFEGKDP